MSEWWTYRLSDFLLFSPRTWHRLFELYHAWLWPAQPLVLLLGVGLLFALWRGAPWAPRACCLALAIAWAWVAWAFHLQRSPTGFALLIGAVTLMPVLGVACGRRWQEAEVFGLTPDATVLGTLGFLLVQVHGGRSRALAAWPWLIPLMWCGVGGATLFALELPWAGLLPLAGLAAVIAGLARRY